MEVKQDSFENNDVPMGLYNAALGQLVRDYVSSLPQEQIDSAAQTLAAQLLWEIYEILENPSLEDPECLQRIDAIVSAYYARLGLRSRRHLEQD